MSAKLLTAQRSVCSGAAVAGVLCAKELINVLVALRIFSRVVAVLRQLLRLTLKQQSSRRLNATSDTPLFGT